jgi:hypothetical protein
MMLKPPNPLRMALVSALTKRDEPEIARHEEPEPAATGGKSLPRMPDARLINFDGKRGPGIRKL